MSAQGCGWAQSLLRSRGRLGAIAVPCTADQVLGSGRMEAEGLLAREHSRVWGH